MSEYSTLELLKSHCPAKNAEAAVGQRTLSKLVYIHIGKTGGTSLRHALQAGGLHCSVGFEQSHMTAADAAHYRAFDAICGHISRADQVKWFPDRRVITILRAPIDRCLSFIHYVRTDPRLSTSSTPFVRKARTMSIIELINTTIGQQNLNNTMVRQLGGHMLDFATDADLPEVLERAKQTLRESAWFGFAETMALDIARLAKKVGAPLQEVTDNVTLGRPSIAEESPGLVNRLAALNQFDLKLYRWAQQQKR